MAESGLFSPEFFRFLRELARNNNREWFRRNKDRYERSVLEPAVRFVEQVGPQLKAISASVVADPRPYGGSVSRIYRDTRFSKDKTPYRTAVGIRFKHETALSSEDHLPGFVLHLAPGDCWVVAGVWHPAPPALKQIRDAIAAKGSGWGRVLRAGVVVDGELAARAPAGYDASHPFAKDLRRKEFYSWVGVKDADVLRPSLGPRFLGLCRELAPLNRFIADALHIPW